MSIQIDLSKRGLEMFFKTWQVKALDYLKSIHPKGANTLTVYTAVNKSTQISRASIINYLNACVDDEILTYTETTGKGGYHRIYTLAHTDEGLETYLISKLIKKLLNEYPVEARNALSGA